MYANANAAYRESRVLSASPVELILILYQAASGAVGDARRHLAAGAIAERSRSVNKACAILAELISALDRDRGGEIAQRLGQLYDYMYARLIEANRQQADAPLAEVLELLGTLSGAWGAVGPAAEPAAAAAEAPGGANRGAENYGAESYGAGSYGAGSYGAGDSGARNVWAQPFPPEAAPAQGYGSHAWSF
jgi:flagellar protein FliS